jgi:hypothetical protein
MNTPQEHDGHDVWPLISQPGTTWCRDCQVQYTPDKENSMTIYDQAIELIEQALNESAKYLNTIPYTVKLVVTKLAEEGLLIMDPLPNEDALSHKGLAWVEGYWRKTPTKDKP